MVNAAEAMQTLSIVMINMMNVTAQDNNRKVNVWLLQKFNTK